MSQTFTWRTLLLHWLRNKSPVCCLFGILHPKKMTPGGENDGSSYMLFTLCTAALGAINVLIDQQTGTQGARVWFAIAATVLYTLNLIGVVFLFWRIWVAQMVEISAFSWQPRILGHRISWRLWRIIDHYLGLNVAFSLILMTFWVWDDAPDKESFYDFPDNMPVRNHWAMWASFIATSFSIYNGVGFNEFSATSPGTVIVTGLHIIFAYPITLIIAGIVVTAAFEAIQDRRQQGADNKQALVNSPVNISTHYEL